MKKSEILKIIKSTVHSLLPDARILLFGSRAKNTYKSKSDYDLLVITKKPFSLKSKLNWKTKIHTELINVLELPFDILLNSEKEIIYKKEISGHIIRNALKDAIEL